MALVFLVCPELFDMQVLGLTHCSTRFLADDYVYEITNKWRKTRGEPKLVRPIADPVMVAHRRSIP